MSENSPSKMLKFRNLLWKLHYKLEKKQSHTSFDKLTDDPLYRAKILSDAVKSDDNKLSELAHKIIEQEIILGIHYELDEDDSHVIIVDTASHKPSSKPSKQSRLFIITLLIVLISLIFYIFLRPLLFNTSNSYSHTSSMENSTTVEKPFLKAITSAANATLNKVDPSDENFKHSQSEVAKKQILSLHGSNTVGEKLAPTLIKAYLNSIDANKISINKVGPVEKTIDAYLANQGWVTVEIQAHGSSTSFQNMDKGSADMGMASRKVKDKEVTLLQDRFGDLTSPNNEHVIGLDGLAVIVNKSNPINQLNTQQLAALFSGEVKNWSELGASDSPVSIYSRDGNSGTWDTFKNLVLKKYSKKLSPDASRYESSTELSDLVAEDIGAIGFIGLPYVRDSKLLAVADDVNSQPIIPTLFTVGTEDYPLSRRLYFYTPTKKSPFMRDFIEFTHSQEGQKVVQEIGFISQNLYTVKPSIPFDAPVSYKNIVENSKRLSLNFRFKTGSNDLDNKSLRDLERLTSYITHHPEKQLSLLGFSDSIGDPSFNIQLSELRAKKIESELNRRGIYPTILKGFGEKMPIASNASKQGRNKNRRVEIWVSS